MSKYSIRQFTDQRLGDVRDQWQDLAGEDEFALELVGLFQWCNTHMEGVGGESQAFELYNQGADRCDAIVELVDSRKGALSKLLKLFLSPVLWDIEKQREKVIELYVDTFTLVIQNGLLKGAKNIKLYGRNDLMFSILRSLDSHWPNNETGTHSSFQGRWLIISIDQ